MNATLPSMYGPQYSFPNITHPVMRSSWTLQERFEEFDSANPHVFVELQRMALARVRAGRKRLSIGQLWEVLRDIGETTHGDEYKLNNSYRSRYARMLERTTPELRGMFELRELRTEEA